MHWDVFCRVIDNHGDIGVCWRLCTQLAERGLSVRLWVDDGTALTWMAPEGHAGVEVRSWAGASHEPRPGAVVIEAFGCELPHAFQAAMAAAAQATGQAPAWINLEYLTAESFAARNHGLASPVLAGPAKGLAKRFFYPGFTRDTGGLIREPELADRQRAFDRAHWLQSLGVAASGSGPLISLFCYEPVALGAFLDLCARQMPQTRLLATAGRATAALDEAIRLKRETDPSWNAHARLVITRLPLLSQTDFDHLLWSCDLNFVRGEDSLVRALWAGKPLVWQLYPQEDNAHLPKLDAFMEWLAAPPALRQFHRAWNGAGVPLPPLDLPGWRTVATDALAHLNAQEDLVTQLLRMAQFTLAEGANK